MIDSIKAVQIVKKMFPQYSIGIVCEFPGFFTVEVKDDNKVLLDSCIGVYKKDGKTFAFNPMDYKNILLKSAKMIKE